MNCEKNKEIPSGETELLNIDSLYISRDSIQAFLDTAYLKVYVSGENFEVRWLANHGTLMGEGEEVIYFAGQCCVGLNTIYCTVFDTTGSITVSLNFEVTSYLK